MTTPHLLTLDRIPTLPLTRNRSLLHAASPQTPVFLPSSLPHPSHQNQLTCGLSTTVLSSQPTPSRLSFDDASSQHPNVYLMLLVWLMTTISTFWTGALATKLPSV